MRSRTRRSGTGFWPIALIALIAAGDGVSLDAAPARVASGSVSELRCESQKDPLGIDERRPRLSWVYESRERDQAQTAYQVLVARTPAALERDRGDVWDSGRVGGPQSVEVVYDGATAREPARSYHWKVRVWDREGRVSPWSAAGRLGDGAARPRGLDGPLDERRQAQSRARRGLLRGRPGAAVAARVHAAGGRARARLYVSRPRLLRGLASTANAVGDHVLDPGWTNYDKRVCTAPTT